MDKAEGNEEARAQVLLAVAESAQTQGNYHLAAKKFTQAGDRVLIISLTVICSYN
jgi:hypothetical protein